MARPCPVTYYPPLWLFEVIDCYYLLAYYDGWTSLILQPSKLLYTRSEYHVRTFAIEGPHSLSTVPFPHDLRKTFGSLLSTYYRWPWSKLTCRYEKLLALRGHSIGVCLVDLKAAHCRWNLVGSSLLSPLRLTTSFYNTCPPPTVDPRAGLSASLEITLLSSAYPIATEWVTTCAWFMQARNAQSTNLTIVPYMNSTWYHAHTLVQSTK